MAVSRRRVLVLGLGALASSAVLAPTSRNYRLGLLLLSPFSALARSEAGRSGGTSRQCERACGEPREAGRKYHLHDRLCRDGGVRRVRIPAGV